MTLLLTLLVSMNAILLFEVVYWHAREQASEGKSVAVGKTFLLYAILVVILWALVYWSVTYFGLG